MPRRLILAAALLEIVWLGFWVAGDRLDVRAPFADRWERALPPVSLVLGLARRPVDALLGPSTLGLNVAFLVGLVVVAFGLYLWALRLISRADDSRRLAALVVAAALGFQLTLFWMPNLFTTDLFSYAVYGQIAGRFGGNPYLDPPRAFPDSPLLPFVSGLWQQELSVYGPVWTAAAALLGAALPPDDVVAQAIAYKAVANAASGLSLVFLWRALAILGRPRAPGLLLFAWNPVVLFEVGANGHNDAVMVAVMLGAVVLALRRREIAGLLLLALAAMIKYTAGLLGPYLLVLAVRRTRSGWVAVGGVALALLAVVLAYLPWWAGPATLAPVFRWTEGPMFANSPVQLAVLGAGELLWLLGISAAPATAGWLGRLFCRGALVAFWVWEARRLRDAAELPAAAARLLVAFLLLGSTWVLPWYFIWPTALAALAGPQTRTARVVVGFDFTALGLIYAFHFHGQSLPPWAFALYLAPLGVSGFWFLVSARRAAPRTRNQS